MKNTTTYHQIKKDNILIEYTLIRKKVKNINLRINNKGQVMVSANNNVPLAYIEDFLVRKSDFITHHVNKFTSIYTNDENHQLYSQGSTIDILGKSLTINLATAMENKAFLRGEEFVIWTTNTEDQQLIIHIVDSYLSSLAKEVFEEIMREVHSLLKDHNIPYPTVTIRSMTSRWGSCRPSKSSITLNKKLIKAPREIIRYVVLHEYAHFIHPNHSKDFHNFVGNYLPKWKSYRKILLNYSINHH